MGKGQVTLFVVIAVLFVAIVGIVFLATQKKLSREIPEIKPIKAFIDNCLDSTAEDALIFTGQQGGYYDIPKNSIDSYVYYFYNNKSFIPSKQKIESEISLYVNEMLPFCTQNFVEFPDFKIEADPYSVKTKTIILGDKVRFIIKWYVSIKKADIKYQLEEFSSEIKSRLNTIYNVAQNITSEQLKDPSSICLSCLTRLGIENDLYIDMENYDDDTVIFTIKDNQTLIKNQPYKFVFANKY